MSLDDMPGAEVSRRMSAEAAAPGAALLDAVVAFVRRFVAFPSDAALAAVSLWVAHTHLIECFENTPRLAALSPEPGSGKTRMLEVLELLCPDPMHVLNASPAAIFRTIERQRPTLLLDEVDTVFTHKGKDDGHADLRGPAQLRIPGRRHHPALRRPPPRSPDVPYVLHRCAAGLGDLPDTLMTRSVVIRMRRRAPGETVEPFRRRLHRADGEDLRDKLADWAEQIRDKVTDDYPDLPDGITDRPADVWEPLLSIADAAGGAWPNRARRACVELVAAARSTDSGSLGVRLLADLRDVFGDAPQLFTETILKALHGMPEAPWNDLKGKPLDPRGLANRLKSYGVTSKKVRIDDTTRQGYTVEDLHDPWQRYLSPVPAEPEHPEHNEQRSSEHPDPVPDADPVPEHQPEQLRPELEADVPADQRVPEHDPQPEHKPPTLTSGVRHVPDVPDSAERESARNGYDSLEVETVSAAVGVPPLDRELWARVARGYDQ